MKNLFYVGLIVLLAIGTAQEKDYTDFVNHLAEKINQDPWKHSAWNRLALITDSYGPRMWGSMVLEQVIYEMAAMATNIGFENVRLEQVKNFTKWVRGN